jgi:hypothetical protein
MPWPPINFHPRNLSERFAELIGGFQRALGKQSNVNHPVAGPLLLLVWNRLAGIHRRFAILAEKVRTGTLRPPAPPRLRPARPGPTPSSPAMPRPKNLFAQTAGWLPRMLPDTWHIGPSCQALQQLLDDPDLAALAAAAPQVGRLLRPLCRMVNQAPPPFLQLPERPRRPRPKPAPKPRAPKFVDINRVSAVAWGNIVHPDHPGQHHPPARIGYGGSWWPPKTHPTKRR